MTYLVERLAELRRHIDHLHAIAPRVTGARDLELDLSLHNDVLFSLLTVCQLTLPGFASPIEGSVLVAWLLVPGILASLGAALVMPTLSV